jgi:c-di-GMP-binding flagellar brake protein YcgR
MTMKIIRGESKRAEVRREHKRQRTRLAAIEVDYKPEGQEASMRTESLNISERGICLLLPERQPWKREADLKIHLPSGKISARGKVAWAQDHVAIWGNIFPTGIRFIEISTANAQKLKSYIRSSLKYT